MWYPSQRKINQIKNSLSTTSDTLPVDETSLNDFLSKVSVAIHSLASGGRLPSHRVWDWIWIGSQLRINIHDKEPPIFFKLVGTKTS